MVDAIHGAIELTQVERQVIDTASFQRLRHLKQLGLGHVTYPNATHTRFVHSLGVLAIMSRVLRIAAKSLDLDESTVQELRLAALLHDIGHYPYSHLMEGTDQVVLTEEATRKTQCLLNPGDVYPDHEEVGRIIVTSQPDLIETIGGKDRAQHVADLFTRSSAADPQLSKLIHSSLDMDRLDYLLRDTRAAGVPYGAIDISYLLNNLKASPSGLVGISYKALPAAEQFLLARYFMHRAVYFHKTTFGLEEAFRQLLRRCRETGRYTNLPRNGKAVRELVSSEELPGFTDHVLDDVARRATRDRNHVIKQLAKAIAYRKPPKLLREECALIDDADEAGKKDNCCSHLLKASEEKLPKLSRDHNIRLGLFLLAEPKPIRLEKRGNLVTLEQAQKQPSEERDELIKVFVPGEAEPQSLVDVPQSIIKQCASRSCRIVRLYVVSEAPDKVDALRKAVSKW